MVSFESLVTYSYKDAAPLRHGACILMTINLVLAFFGGYWSAQIGWRWPVIFVVWIFWKNLSILTYDVIGAKYKEEHAPARYIFALVPALFFLAFYGLGYYAGPLGWWWLCLVVGFVYSWLLKIIQKHRGE